MSLDRDSVSTPPRALPSRSTVSPRKEEYAPDDDGYDSDEVPPNPDSGFLIRGKLVAPRTEARKFHHWDLFICLIHEGTIDLNPPYQREIVWPAQKQALLIDSLFRNFYIPPVVFAVRMDEDDVPTRRPTAVHPVKKQHFYYTSPEKVQRLQIPDEEKIRFGQMNITCIEYSELTPTMEREIFQRVQLGMPLTTAEKLAAVDSPWAEWWITQLEHRHISIDGGLSETLHWDTKRGREFQNVAQFVYCCDGYPDSENVPTAPKMEKEAGKTDRHQVEFVFIGMPDGHAGLCSSLKQGCSLRPAQLDHA
ncbi:hypothetical protein B0H17DRAFT_1143428 [Mycena rosella]|uniref:DUF262 domain-containing protein n=1 Tax=Mycena rosella TaxID=1033263 RepID=A0AAD7CVP5_MYCRO|nr:hypothetical protein B0H17DRAFT_1143428 [Mycena rosella]